MFVFVLVFVFLLVVPLPLLVPMPVLLVLVLLLVLVFRLVPLELVGGVDHTLIHHHVFVRGVAIHDGEGWGGELSWSRGQRGGQFKRQGEGRGRWGFGRRGGGGQKLGAID